jgi:hypothetical protein
MFLINQGITMEYHCEKLAILDQLTDDTQKFPDSNRLDILVFYYG